MGAATEEKKNDQARKKSKGAGLVILILIFLILFLLTTAILGAHLYKMATRDQYTVDMGLGEPDGSSELFRIQYENDKGEITVQGANADKVVAPGTEVDYDIRLRNEDEVIVDFVMTPEVTFLTDSEVPVKFKIVDAYGNYILGSASQWATATDMNNLVHKGSIHPGEVSTYHISWQWAFEVSDVHDTYDTFLGGQVGENTPGIRVAIRTESSANPTPVRDNRHMMHLLGDGFGCCWCCYLVWLLVLIILLMLVRMHFMRRKVNKQKETLDDYEEVLIRHGLLVDGELVDREPLEQLVDPENAK